MSRYEVEIDFMAEADDLIMVATEIASWLAEHAPACTAKITELHGPAGGATVIILGSQDEEAIYDALVIYAGGDLEHALDLFEDVIMDPYQ